MLSFWLFDSWQLPGSAFPNSSYIVEEMRCLRCSETRLYQGVQEFAWTKSKVIQVS